MKRLLAFFALLTLAAAPASAYDFSAAAPTGQTLYYNIISGTNNVEVTCPGSSHPRWDGYTQPSGALTIPSSVEYNGTTYTVTAVGESAFEYCPDLTSVTLPNSVTTIGESAFESCISLASVTLPSSVTTIGDYAFGNTNLTSVTIPDSVTAISNSAFHHCDSLVSVTIPNSVTTIGEDAFMGCSSLATVTIPNSVTDIGREAFAGCYRLASVTIPNSVTAINEGTFSSCQGLASVAIPNSVTSIGERAFSNCYSLASIISENADAPSVADNSVFSGVSRTIPVYIPCGSLQSYTTNWGAYFSNFREPHYFLTVVSADPAAGTVEVLDEPDCSDSSATVQAVANSGYHFDHWSDGSTQNPYTLVLTSDTSLTAYFVSDSPVAVTQVEGSDVIITVDRADVTVRGAVQQPVRIYDVRGRLLASEAKAAEAQTFRMAASGAYIVQVADRPAEKVVVVR